MPDDYMEMDGFADLQRSILRTDYNEFATAALAPFGQAPAKHHQVLIAALQKLIETPGSRLMVMMPPGSAKTTYCSILFPPFVMQFPGIETVITASASAELAEGFLTKAYRVATDMKEVLGYGFEQARLNSWRTTNGSELRAFGAGAGMAGKRADCLVGSTEVITPDGPATICDVVFYGPQHGTEVLSWDKTTRKIEFRKVVATRQVRSSSILRITTDSGQTIESTSQHKFYTKRGWVNAGRLTSGDILTQVCPVEGNVSLTTVFSVEKLAWNDLVYDIQVEGTQCFFANNILVHNCVIIDDPFGSWKDAASQGKRDVIWDWYQGDVINRLRPGGRILLVMTHWHSDDLAGRLLEAMQEGGPKWDVIRMQAIYDGTEVDPIGRNVGEALWPEWEGLESLNMKRATNGEMKWSALFQQNPIASMGLLFPVDNIMKVDEIPAGERVSARYWDLAGTEERMTGAGDWTVGLKLTQVGNTFVVEDVIRRKLSPDGVRQLILETAANDGRSCIIGLPQDPGSAGKFVVSDLVAMLAGYVVKPERETGKKADRALPVASQVEAGNLVMLPRPWNITFIEELRGFPNAKHDDQVDALAGAFKRLFRPARRTQALNVPWGVR